MRRFKPTGPQRRVLDRIKYFLHEVHDDGDLTISLGGPAGDIYILDRAGRLYKYLSMGEMDTLVAAKSGGLRNE